jgi:aryl-alcohol dehydrogenase-like predicted oxidoreductase
LYRERFENEYAPLFHEQYKIGTTIWSPLASGLLTGKYNEEIPVGSRADSDRYPWLKARVETWKKEGKIDKVKLLTKYAEDNLKCSVSQLALAWCIKNKNVSTVLLGATKPSQLEENFGALDVARRLTEADMKAIEEILNNKPEAYSGYGGAGSRNIDTI